MHPDFLTPERKKKNETKTNKTKQFFGKFDSEKNTKNFIVTDNNKMIRPSYLQEAPGEHTYLQKKTGIFLVKITRN